MRSHLIGIDIGGTGAKLGFVDAEGTVLARARVPTGYDVTGDQLVEALMRAVQGLRAQLDATSLGVAAPGMRRPDGEGVVNVTNLPHIDGYPLREALENATGLPTVLDNDANAAALGEYRFGAGQGISRLLVMTVGTGIGGGMVVDGAIHRIACQGLGDPGHVIVSPGGPRCGCGGRGCVETLAAVPAILRRAETLRGSAFGSLGEVVAAARAGDPAAGTALREAGSLLGTALATLTHLLAPERILLGGGGIDAAEELLIEPIRASLFDHVQPYLGERLSLRRAALGNDAGLIGAAALAPSN